MSLPPSNAGPIQDMPPPGGYRKVDMGRLLQTRGPKGWQLWAGSSLMIMYGFYQIGQTSNERREEQVHERRLRYAMAPILQAEADREYHVRELIILKKEAEIMKDVEGWVVGRSPYWTQKFMPRAVNPFDRSNK
mmetsp:Transcript_2632/g.2885  ORF Transcript_2632/g.2885 Transcript_2632/m.2885 type:complete len:134 (+) Transcript_2632:55-456(+)|eukprot:CAMPEP_0198262800 /NCGR_PEP_ID=MMETSP1447-20131203/11255_1 /TAXON_ID=420782 /ORGANISM="Chaetoceros dichaeta, Strain CCMP1751" /LENGTH=133 /DNA_ID=CAMNT_0043951171 /DNA_START=52 /DNA_END=453 /DNA_ORIENTATION=-